ncbi:unnamed protein product [Caenorhabditis nigoni]
MNEWSLLYSSCSRCWKVGKSWKITEGKSLWRRKGKTSDRGGIIKIETFRPAARNISNEICQRHKAKPEINEARDEEEET